MCMRLSKDFFKALEVNFRKLEFKANTDICLNKKEEIGTMSQLHQHFMSSFCTANVDLCSFFVVWHWAYHLVVCIRIVGPNSVGEIVLHLFVPNTMLWPGN